MTTITPLSALHPPSHLRCLVKNPDERATATELLDHQFIRAAQPAPVTLTKIIQEATEARAQQMLAKSNKLIHIQPQPVDQSQVRGGGGGGGGAVERAGNGRSRGGWCKGEM